MKVFALLAAVLLSVSLGYAVQSEDGSLLEMKFSVEGLPVYTEVSTGEKHPESRGEFTFDTTALTFLIKRSVDPGSWSKPGVIIEPSTSHGMNVLRIVQTQANQEAIVELLSEIKRASPHYIKQDRERLVGTSN
ncbi:MAG: hypothetical protein MUC83_07045 [Pirellula sp.]|jgi:hypothetical protein|nr:hypothetical protein [Pirellula sp.]